jgi:hypothetical protein
MNPLLTSLFSSRATAGRVHRVAGVALSVAFAAALVACGGANSDKPAAQAAAPMEAESSARALQVTGGKLPIGLSHLPYEIDLAALSGRKGPFTVVEGAIPEGLELDAATGRITGRAGPQGEYQFTVRSIDASGKAVDQAHVLRIDTTTGSYDNAPTEFKPRDERKRALSGSSSTTNSGANPLASSALAGIVAGMAEGEWRRVNLNSYSSAWTPVPLRTLYAGGEIPPDRIISAWSSFAWDSTRGNLFLYGGGHANYRGNDTYLWRGSSQMWERGSLPSEMVQTPLAWNAIDGAANAPAAAHTYDNTVYLPKVDRVLVLGGAADSNGGHFLTQNPGSSTTRITGPYLFDPSRAHPDRVGGTTGSHVRRVAPYPEIVGGQMWSNRESWLNASATSTPPSEPFINTCTGYAEENGRDVVYVRTEYRIWRYELTDLNNPAADRWSQAGRYWFAGSGSMGTCGYDPVRRLLVSTHWSLTQPFIFWNMATQGSNNRDTAVAPVDPTGEFAGLVSSRAINLANCGFEYDPTRGNFKLWCGDGRVWSVTPPAVASATGWTIVRHPTAPGMVPSDSIGTGILGKWKYVPNLDVFMGLSDATNGNIWIYKPVGWVNPFGPVNLPPQVTLTAPTQGTTVAAGSDIALSATASDPDGTVQIVEFFANGTKVGQATQSPYVATWSQPASGTYSVTARATDAQGGATTTTGVSVTVQPPILPNVPPIISWASPASDNFQTNVGLPITLQANASDSDGSVTKVEFFLGATKLGEATAPFSFVWNGAPLGTHSLTMVATDDDLATTTSVARTVVVNPAPAGGTTVTLQRGTAPHAVADTYLSRFHRTTAWGSDRAAPDQNNWYSPLVRFAIFQSEGGPVPNGARITSAVLSLYKTTEYNMNYSAFRMLVDWQESTATWVQRMPGQPWGAEGANGSGTDFAAVADASTTVGWDPAWVNFNVTASVQQMSSAASPNNFGWRIRGTGGYVSGLKWFNMSEFAGSATLRPRLVITYE